VEKLIQHSILTKRLRDDKDKNFNRSDNAEIKITTVKDRNKTQQENKKSTQKEEKKSVVKQKKEAQKLKGELSY